MLWFGTDTCTISSDSRIPVHAQLNYQPSIGNNGKPLFYKSKADTITGIYNYIMCKNDTGLQAAESTALGTVFNHIATLEDADTVIGCQLTNEPGVGRLHGGIKADHCMCETCLADKGSLGMNATDFRNYTLWNFNNILGAAVKNSKHSVWTRVNLDESSNSTGIVKYNEEVRKTSGANIDFIGIDHYRKTPTQLATEGVAGNTFAQGQNLTMIMELGQKDARDKGLYMTKGTSKKWVTTTFGEIALTKGVHTFRYTVTSLATTSGTLPLDFLYLERIDDLVDYSELQALYDEYKDTEKGNYTEDSWNVFQEALSKTKSMLDAQAATKSEVKAQIGLLQQAVDKLEINTDKSKEELYAEYEALVREAEEEIKKTDHYTEENIKKLNDAITTAKTKDLIDQGDPAISASAVATALEKFRAVYAAFKATEQIPAIDKTALQQAVEANTGKQEADYTAESWTAFAKALERARAILADPNALQNDVDAAAKALTDAAAALTVKPTEEAKPAPTVETKVVTDDLSDNNIPDSLKNVGYDTPEKITEKLKLESSKKLSSDNIVVYEVKLQVSKDGVTWVDATAENFPKNGLEISFTLPNGITAETAAQYDFIVSHMKDSGEVELLTPALKDGKLVVTVSSLSPFGISWKRKEQPKPSEEPKPTQAPTATPAPTAAPAASDASSNSSNSSGTTSAPASTAAPKATAAPTAPATVIPQTADSFPLILLAMLALCSAAALTGLVICRKKKH